MVTLFKNEQLRKELEELVLKKVKDEFTKTVDHIKKQYQDLINSFETKNKVELTEVVIL